MVNITAKDVLTYLPILTTIGLAIYIIRKSLRPKIGLVNPDIQKDIDKVILNMDVEEIEENITFCRCWRSKQFPLCDGSHNAHNKKMGDNVGPICLRKRVQCPI